MTDDNFARYFVSVRNIEAAKEQWKWVNPPLLNCAREICIYISGVGGYKLKPVYSLRLKYSDLY